MTTKTFIPLLLMLLLGVTMARGQSGLAVQEAFRRYAVRSDVTEVVIEGNRLKPYRLSRFHSIEVGDASHGEAEYIASLIRRDTVGCVSHEGALQAPPAASDIHSGRVQAPPAASDIHTGRVQAPPAASACFELPRRRSLHRYIFYRSSAGKVLLIYIEGRADMTDLKRFFKKDK